MTTDQSSETAWIAVPSADELPDAIREEVGDITGQIGFVFNLTRLLGMTPRHFVGWWRYFDDLFRGPSNLTKTQREMIAVVVSAELRCPY